MFKNFGFYMPDAEYLKDPEGLLKYLVRLDCCNSDMTQACLRVSVVLQGAMLQYGHLPVRTRGDDDTGCQFRSLRAVQLSQAYTPLLSLAILDVTAGC